METAQPMMMSARPIRRVVLVEPAPSDLHIYSRFPMPRLGVILLGTILKKRGLDVNVFVEQAKELDRNALLHADLVGISSITSTAQRSYRLADEMRSHGIPVVMGGPHPTHCPDEALDHCDFVVRGEGEESLPALIDAIVRGQGFETVPNLSYRDAGTIVHRPTATPVKDLDEWPDPDLRLVDRFSSTSLLRHRTFVPIQTSRGCPHDCSFCTVTSTFGRTMRYRSVDRVIAEMGGYNLKKSSFFFYDDNFTADHRRTRELLRGFDSLPRTPRWSAQVRADVAKDEDLLDRMAATGCKTLYIGLESINQESLASTNKRQRIEDVELHLRRIRSRHINVHGMFVFGFDTDLPGTMERTVAFAKRHGLFSVQLMILTPLPGSRLAAEMQDSGRVLHQNWSQYDAHHVCFQPANISPSELQDWQIQGHRYFYSLGRLAGCLFRGNLAGVMITLYAAALNRKWRRSKALYLEELRRLSDRIAATDRIRRKWSPT